MAKDNVNHPEHYTRGGIECIAAIRASMDPDGFSDYCKGNVLKYLWRWRDKGGVEDLRKARVYLDWLIDVAPTIDAEPVRHGHWIAYRSGVDTQCSECEWSTDFPIARKYCPNCGAKMDEVSE